MTRKLSAESIIKTYTTLVSERGGVPIGERVFTRETGISRYHWMGGHWRSWSAFQEAAGYSPNDPTQKIPDEVLLHRFAELAAERGEVPTEADINLKRKEDPSSRARWCLGVGEAETLCLKPSLNIARGKRNSRACSTF